MATSQDFTQSDNFLIYEAIGGGGGGAGSATKTNQETQIEQLNDTLGASVFKNAAGDSVFLSTAGNVSVANILLQLDTDTLAILNSTNSIKQTQQRTSTNNLDGGTVLVQSFSATTLAAAALLLQNFLQLAGLKYIINISFSSAGATQHDIILVYNQ